MEILNLSFKLGQQLFFFELFILTKKKLKYMLNFDFLFYFKINFITNKT